MPQSLNSQLNPSPSPLVKAQPLRRLFKAHCCALALALGVLGGDASAAQQGGGAGSARGSKAEQPVRKAEKKAESLPVDEDTLRVASALSQIATALESGKLNTKEAFTRIDEVKKNWIKMKKGEPRAAQAAKRPAKQKGGAKGELPVAEPIIAAANEAAAARKKAARLKAAAVRDANFKAAAAGPRDGAKSGAAPAPRKKPVSVEPVAAADKNLSTLVANYNAAEKRLNEMVAAGAITRQNANRQLEKIRNDLRAASGAASQGKGPEDTTRYKDRERDLAREVARGLTSARDAQRELSVLRRTIASEQKAQKEEAKRADERLARQKKREALEKWEAEQARAAAERKARQQKRANRKKKAAAQSDG